MKRIAIALIALVISTGANAQQPATSDPATLRRVLAITQAQRNQFLDALNDAAARVDVLTEDLGKAQAKIKELDDEKRREVPTGEPH